MGLYKLISVKPSLYKSLVLVFALSVAFVACEDEPKPSNTTTTSKPKVEVNAPDFNGDSAYSYVQQQVGFGPRVPETPAHDSTLAWLSAKLEGYADKVYLQTDRVEVYNGQQKKFTNVIAAFNPESVKRIMLSAHWDTRPYGDHDEDPTKWSQPILGANDGASGVGVLLEVARLLKAYPVKVGVDIILFDIEDYGQPEFDKGPQKPDTYGLGSQYWAKNPHVPNYDARFGILLDMVGAKGSMFRMEGYSMQFAPSIVKKVWAIGGELGYGQHFVFLPAQPIQDDHYYVNVLRGVPTIDIIHLAPDPQNNRIFHPSWHTHDDTMENIDPKVLKAVGQTLMEVIHRENAGVF